MTSACIPATPPCTPSVRMLGLSIGILLSLSTWAQTPPNAGSILQQMESLQPKATGPLPPPPLLREAELQQAAPGMTIRVTGFRFTGNRQLSDQELAAALDGLLGKDLSFADLQDAAARVARLYAHKGWVVRTFLPQQDITAGTITIAVVEAKFGQVWLEGPESAGITHQRLKDMAERALRMPEPVSAPGLERLLLTYADLPGVDVSGSLIAGPGEGETSLRVRVQERARVNGSVILDNSGSRAYGMTRTLTSMSWNSPSRQGDQLQALGVVTEGSRYGRLAYAWPADLMGAKWSVAISGMHYRLTAPEFAALQASGTAHTLGMEYIRPLWRSQRRNLFWSLGVDQKAFQNFSAETLTGDYSTRTAYAGLSANGLDEAGGLWNLDMSAIIGQLQKDGEPNPAADAGADRISTHFHKLKLATSRVQSLTASSHVQVSLSGQYAPMNLDASEKFYLGGPAGVRGFPTGEGGGKDGLLLHLEWYKRWLARLGTGVFVSAGMIHNKHAGGTPLNVPKQYSLSAGGIMLQWEGPGTSTLKTTWSRRLRGNPNANADGKDQDGSYVRDRLWLQASWPF